MPEHQSRIQLVSLENPVKNRKITQFLVVVKEQCRQAILENLAHLSYFPKYSIGGYLVEVKFLQSVPLFLIIQQSEEGIIGRKQLNGSLGFNSPFQQNSCENFQGSLLHKRALRPRLAIRS